jgi:hypothetical protein
MSEMMQKNFLDSSTDLNKVLHMWFGWKRLWRYKLYHLSEYIIFDEGNQLMQFVQVVIWL